MHNKKGMISSFFALAEEQQHLYLPYVPKFIREEYHRRFTNNT